MARAQLKSVLVTKPLTHEGRSYVRGDRLMVRPVAALALRRKGFVTVTRGAVVEPPLEPEPTRSRRSGARKTATPRRTRARSLPPDPDPGPESVSG